MLKTLLTLMILMITMILMNMKLIHNRDLQVFKEIWPIVTNSLTLLRCNRLTSF
jgi:hypothetical protein